MNLDHQYSILIFLPVYFKYVHQYNGVTYTMKGLMALNNLEGTVNYKRDKGCFYCSIPYTYVTYYYDFLFNIYNIGTRDLPDIHTQTRGPEAPGRGHNYISGKSQVPRL